MGYYDNYDDDYEVFEVYEDDAEIYQRRPSYPRRPPVYRCPSGTTTYYVRYGDTINRIARAYGVRAYDIIRVNPNIDQRRLYVGQRICIPIRRR